MGKAVINSENKLIIKPASQIKRLTKSQITEAALIQLKAKGFTVWRENNIAVRRRKFIGKRGKPDIIGYCGFTGLAVYCEVKTINDVFSDDQKKFLTDASKAGCYCCIATEENGMFVLNEYE